MKKKKRNAAIRIRRSWNINPKTRIKKSSKTYARQKSKKELTDLPEGYL